MSFSFQEKAPSVGRVSLTVFFYANQNMAGLPHIVCRISTDVPAQETLDEARGSSTNLRMADNLALATLLYAARLQTIYREKSSLSDNATYQAHNGKATRTS
jgi:hypothetical protein